MEETKPWYKSKTLWVNIIGFFLIALQYFLEAELVKPEIAGVIMAVLNGILRFISPKTLTLKDVNKP